MTFTDTLVIQSDVYNWAFFAHYCPTVKSFRGQGQEEKRIITDGDNIYGLESSPSYFLLNLSQEAVMAAYTEWWMTLLSLPVNPLPR